MLKKIFLVSVPLLFSLTALAVPDLAELNRMASRFAPVNLKVDTSKLSSGDKKALPKLLKASKILDKVFMNQFWSGNLSLKTTLEQDQSDLGRARLRNFIIDMGPWSSLDHHAAFISGVPADHPAGANFYPEDMKKEEFESWVKTLSKDQEAQAKGFFTVIKRAADHRLKIVPFSQEYADDLKEAATLLKSAASDTTNTSLKKFLVLRAEAFLSDDYYASDVAWMDLDASVEITIGPYETYNDEIFGYKASFESFVTLRDEIESNKLKFFSGRLQEVEDHLPIEAQYRNPKLGASSPIRVVNQILSSGDANHGVRTAAFNLPNDEKVVNEKGSKRVMVKNVQEAKFKRILVPISKLVLSESGQKDLSFESFFTHILAHELSHGIGPHKIKIQGKDTDPRQELKEVYSAIEEAKADITGLFMLQYLFDHQPGSLKSGEKAERSLYTTFLASAFRTLRFGIGEAHGKGMAMQFNFILEKGGFRVNPKDGLYEVDFSKIKDAVRDLTHLLMTLEATGDYAGASKLLTEKAVVGPDLKKALDKLSDLPTDILPISITANKLMTH